MRGHIAADTASYRPTTEMEEWKDRDPIRRLEERLIAARVISDADVQTIWAAVKTQVEEAKAVAQQHPDILPTDLGLGEMFSTPTGGA